MAPSTALCPHADGLDKGRVGGRQSASTVRKSGAPSVGRARSRSRRRRGRRYCFLFTDLANPTANRIYQQIGYRPVRDVDEYTFS